MKKSKSVRRVKRKQIIKKVSRGFSSPIILGVILVVFLLGGGTFLAYNTATKAKENSIDKSNTSNISEKKQLQLETFYISPTESVTTGTYDYNESYDDTIDVDYNDNSYNPGVYPSTPSVPLPTVIISSSGCTFTIGFWKNHAGFGPQADAVTPLLPIWLGTPNGTKSVLVSDARKAVELLNMNNDPSNGVNKLYAQMLGSLLNLKAGAPDNGIPTNDTMVFLSQYNETDWSLFTSSLQQQVNQWAIDFDEYNNGYLGVPHCP